MSSKRSLRYIVFLRDVLILIHERAYVILIHTHMHTYIHICIPTNREWGFAHFMTADLLQDPHAGYMIDGKIRIRCAVAVTTASDGVDVVNIQRENEQSSVQQSQNDRSREVAPNRAAKSIATYVVKVRVAGEGSLIKHTGAGLLSFENAAELALPAGRCMYVCMYVCVCMYV